MEKFINDERNKKTEENIQKAIDLFKKRLRKKVVLLDWKFDTATFLPNYIFPTISQMI